MDPMKIVLEYTQMKKTAKQNGLGSYVTQASVAKKHGVSERTLRRMIEKAKAADTADDLRPATSERGRKRDVPPEVEKEVTDWVLARHKDCTATTAQDVKEYLRDKHQIEVQHTSYISRMLHRNGITSLKTQKKKQQQMRPTFEAEVDAFRLTMEKPSGFASYVVMDETGVWSDSVVPRSYGPIGSHSTYVAAASDRGRDTVVLAVRSDGSKLPLWYLEHQPQRTKNKQVY